MKIASMMVLLGAMAGSGYYWNEVRVARAETPMLVARAFERYGRALEAGDLPVHRKQLILAIEDPAFEAHRGVDLKTPGAGMTTISQGLVKLLYFPEGFRPGIRKIRQTLIAQYAFDRLVPKTEQLTLYLNATYFGTVDEQAVHGMARAAAVYFGKTWQALSDDEFIALIGMTIRPNDLKPGSEKGSLRLARVKDHLAGRTKPASVLDVEYTGLRSGTWAEEALMAVLRLVTDAAPSPPPAMASYVK